MSAQHLAHAIHHGPLDNQLWRLYVILSDHTNPTTEHAALTWQQIWNHARMDNTQAVHAIRRLEDGGWIEEPRITGVGVRVTVNLTT